MEEELILEAKTSSKTSIIVKKVFPIILLAIEKNTSKYKKTVGEYITSHHKQLYANAPYTRISFSKEQYDAFWRALNISPNTLAAQMKDCFFWNMNYNPRSAKNPFTAAMVGIIKYYLKKKNTTDAELSTVYLAFSGQFYPSIHFGCYKFEPNENVMEYVVNNMLSEKFTLKKCGNIFSSIRNICSIWLNAYSKNILSEDMDDYDYGIVVEQLHDRIRSFMVNIARLYYQAYENRDYLNYAQDNLSDENYHTIDNNSMVIDRVTEKAMDYLTTKDINYALCGMAADQNVKKDEIKDVMSSICHNKENFADLRKVLNIIIADFVRSNPNEPIHGVKFITYAMTSKPNSKDKDIIFLRTTIVRWLNTNSPAYVRRKKRAPTASSYYSAVLKMLVLSINEANK